jgi:hypothetical protein
MSADARQEALALGKKKGVAPMQQRLVGIIALCTLILSGCTGKPSSGTDSEARPRAASEAEAKWSREVAEHFLNAYAAEQGEAVRALCTKSYAKQIAGPNISGGPVVFTITRHELSPNLEQASVKGVASFAGAGKRRSFSMLMEKEEGRWKVSSLIEGGFE